jgi:hypothetical protein
MKSIYKYTLGPAGRQTIDIPTGFKVRHVGPQRVTSATMEGIQLWAEVDPNAPTVAATFEMAGTGHPVPVTGIYCGTAVMGDGFIWHIYLVGTAP